MPSEENKASTIVGDYCVKLPEDMRSVTNLMERASKDQLDSLNALKALYAELHRMGGSALCMGYPFLGESMRELSNVLAEKIASKLPRDVSWREPCGLTCRGKRNVVLAFTEIERVLDIIGALNVSICRF